MQQLILALTLLCTCGLAQTTLSAQLRLTIDGGIAIANFDQKPILPASTRIVFGLSDGQTESFEPLESGFIGLGMAHQPWDKNWGWSTRLQFMKRGYLYMIEADPGVPTSRGRRVHSYTSFIDGMAQLTRTVAGKLRVNAGPYFSVWE